MERKDEMEKAKAYNEVLEKAKEIINDTNASSVWKGWLCNCFPELKESEDEGIRKALIRLFTGNNTEKFGEFTNKQFITWLEKQGDKCLVNFDEAEKEKYDFVSGQFIECRKSFNEFKEDNSYWLEYIGDDTYIGRSDNVLNQKFHITPQQLFTLFTKQYCCWKKEKQDEQEEPQVYEMGDGEVITYSESEGYKVIEQKPTDKKKTKFNVDDWCIDNEDGVIFQIVKVLDNTYIYKTNEGKEYSCSHYSLENDAHLWTIQDAKDGDVLADYAGVILFRKIGNGRYADVVDYYCVVNTCGRFEIQENFDYWGKINNAELCPATKEQRDILLKAMAKAGYTFDFERKKLEKIESKTEENKENIGGISTNSEWSEEDEWKFSDILALLRGGENCHYNTPDLFDWLKTLKDRVQPKQEWSEEDKKKAKDVIFLLEQLDEQSKDDKYPKELIAWVKSFAYKKYEWSEYDKDMFDAIEACCKLNRPLQPEHFNWLKSLKDRVQPQGECDSNPCKEIREAIIDLILDNIDNGVLFHKGVDCQDMIRFLENK